MTKRVSTVRANPRLDYRKTKKGITRISLRYNLGSQPYFDEHTGETKYKTKHKRKSLDLSLITTPRTPNERAHNKSTLELAQKIRYEKEQQFKEQVKGYRLKREENINYLDFFENYLNKYTKRDKRNIKVAFNRFKDFLNENKQYSIYKDYIKPEHLTKNMMRDFVDYLQSRSKGEGAKTIYQRFKKVLNYAIEEGILLNNPCKGVVCKSDESTLKKDILSMEEIKQLINTTYKNQNPQVRDAFIFCLCTGLRFCDVKDLTYSNIDYSNKILTFEQHKTRGYSSSSGVVVPLSDTALELIGTASTDNRKTELIFELPSYTSCSKALKRWVKRAGINKHITWHCARHSFATNSLIGGANISTVGSLLGHSGLKHTMRYLKAVDEDKRNAVNRMNFNL